MRSCIKNIPLPNEQLLKLLLRCKHLFLFFPHCFYSNRISENNILMMSQLEIDISNIYQTASKTWVSHQPNDLLRGNKNSWGYCFSFVRGMNYTESIFGVQFKSEMLDLHHFQQIRGNKASISIAYSKHQGCFYFLQEENRLCSK